jgi:hypothetical protein
MTEQEDNSRADEVKGNNKLAAFYTVVILGVAAGTVLMDGEVETAEVVGTVFLSAFAILPIWGFLGEMKDAS